MNRTSKKRRRLLLLGVALFIPACAYLSLRHEPMVLQSPELVELSGLARSEASPDLLWGLNDSGDTPRLFRIGLRGEDGGSLPVADPTGAVRVENEDWEDLASFRWQQQPALLVGDIGDNMNWRGFIKLYAVAEPEPGAKSADLLWRLDVQYPDGPRDAEGMAVDPLTGDILLLSKRDKPPRLYRVPMPATAPAPGSPPVKAEFVGEVLHIPRPTAVDLLEDPIYGLLRNWVTAFTISPDGLSAVVVTYKDAYRYTRVPGQPWAEVFARQPELIDVPQMRQTEAATISSDGATLYVGSEKHGGFVALPLR